ncbi:Translocation and assembly module TamA precursor [Roseovarius gaetbuli]|uniref:Translocation and assembly module TamA n=1 Tax=Roseovarius gaetbuli TaxID=1356575 RepID=A0A1X6Y3N1_9RHOB|nr:BamA/TamA family outer membrane protein [Roseovarius gaetbuli]SLN09674.1 Translocation and assembly module TamA precursor [Roseovarius gaetbuli]
MAESHLKHPLFAALFAALLPFGAQAADVTFTAPQASEDFTDKLRSASLSLTTAARDDATAQDLLAAAQSDYARLIGVLYAEGFYGGVITIRVDGKEAASIPPLRAPGEIRQIDITVDRRAEFAFGTARVAPLHPRTVLPEGFATGKPARGDLIGAAARTGVEGWRAKGHAKAEVADQAITADHARKTLDADITLAPGPRLRFGALEVEASERPSRVRPSRIRAIAGLPTGKTFSPEALGRSATRLRRTGAFRSVVMTEAETPNADGTLDITTRVVDAKRRRVDVGAELSSLEGLTLTGFWLHRNLLGGAERLRFDAMVGGIGGDSGGEDYRLSARYDRPATFSADTNLFLLASIEENNEPDYRERSVEIGGGLSHIFSKYLTAEAGISYRYSEIDDDLGSRSLQHLLFPLRATWDRRRDSALNPKSGQFVDLTLTPFLGLESQSGNGARLFADARTYHSVGAADRFTLAARAQLGSVAGAKVTDVPADMLFYSGGAGTVRGQAYQSLGVELSPGVTVGGRAFMAFSGELRADVTKSIQAVTFADTGYVAQDALGTGQGDWHSGAGIGARYMTGVGPIRVDLATPLDSGAGQDFELYIGIGQAF